jgi:hypothetical protein
MSGRAEAPKGNFLVMASPEPIPLLPQVNLSALLENLSPRGGPLDCLPCRPGRMIGASPGRRDDASRHQSEPTYPG